MGEDSNLFMKNDFIMNFLDSASDELISELFNKAVDLVNGKNKDKPMSIPFQPINQMPYFYNPIVVTLPNVMKPNYNPQIICSECELDNDDLGDYLNWLGG